MEELINAVDISAYLVNCWGLVEGLQLLARNFGVLVFLSTSSGQRKVSVRVINIHMLGFLNPAEMHYCGRCGRFG